MEQVSDLAIIRRDLEFLKRAVSEIMVAVEIEPELTEEAKRQIEKSKEEIARGECFTHEEVGRELGLI